MGHYASEMHQDKYRKEAAEDRRKRITVAMKIRKDINRRGLEEVLADIVLDPQLYKIHIT